jgi:hypothetical protein
MLGAEAVCVRSSSADTVLYTGGAQMGENETIWETPKCAGILYLQRNEQVSANEGICP